MKDARSFLKVFYVLNSKKKNEINAKSTYLIRLSQVCVEHTYPKKKKKKVCVQHTKSFRDKY
jgi:hypothetical protein